MRRTCSLVVFLSLAALPSADVHVVDASGGPGSDFTDVAAAVLAAADGDTLLLRSGVYGAVVIDDKGLAILADTGADVDFTGSVAVTNLAAGKELSFTALDLRTQALGPSLSIDACAGAVLVQDCALVIQETGAVSSGDAVRVTDSAAVSFTRCDIVGASELIPFGNGVGLEVVDSSVSVYDSTISGPAGQPGDPFAGAPGAQGGAAVYLDGGTLLLSGTTAMGGIGGEGSAGNPFGGGECTDGGIGGPALQLLNDPTVRLLDSQLVGGEAGPATLAPCVDGTTGPPVLGTGVLVSLDATARHYEAVTPIRDGEIFSDTYGGKEGDLAFGIHSHDLLPLPFLSDANGTLWPDLFTAGFASIGALPVGGEAHVTFPVSFAGIARETFVQGLFVDVQEGFVVSNPQSVVFLGPGL